MMQQLFTPTFHVDSRRGALSISGHSVCPRDACVSISLDLIVPSRSVLNYFMRRTHCDLNCLLWSRGRLSANKIMKLCAFFGSVPEHLCLERASSIESVWLAVLRSCRCAFTINACPYFRAVSLSVYYPNWHFQKKERERDEVLSLSLRYEFFGDY